MLNFSFRIFGFFQSYQEALFLEFHSETTLERNYRANLLN
jgi:hypothetical protein